MSRALPTREDLTGRRFGKLEVICRSDKRGSRGSRTVPLWKCRCECGNITYKATDTLTDSDLSMCGECAKKYAATQMRAKAGFVDGTQISRIIGDKPNAGSSSGARGVYLDKRTGNWRARLRFKGKLYSLGTYPSFDDAVEARKKAESVIYGEFLDQLE